MPRKILICDDDVDFTKALMLRLKSRGYEIVVASDGVQSVTVAHKEKPDLIILDIKMPAGSGDSVYENLQRSTLTSMIPVILLSALSPQELEEKAKQLKVTDYISKPYEPSELFQKIQKALGEA